MPESHDDHDLALVVAYADRELTGDDLAAATAIVESCSDCAMLVADLRTIGDADRSMATPARPRDFRLTPADAVRVMAESPEPVAAGARLTDDMNRLLEAHPAHDPLVIAAATDGHLDGTDRGLADAWLAGCGACRELHADLLAIADANRAMPTPARPRDLQLTPADARRARGRGWRGLFGTIGTARDGFSRPLALGLTALGLAGLLLAGGGSLLPGLSGGSSQILSTVGSAVSNPNAKAPDGAAGGPSTVDDPNVFTGQGEAAPSAAASAAAAAAPLASGAQLASAAPAPIPDANGPIEMTGGAAGTSDAYAAASAEASAAPAASDAARNGSAAASEATGSSPLAQDSGIDGGPSAVVIVSTVLLGVGLALFALRWQARRRAAV